MSSKTIIRPYNVTQYIKCPQRARRSWNETIELSPPSQIISNVIKRSYISHVKSGKIPSWKRFTIWTEMESRKFIGDLINQKTRTNNDTLVRLYDWYHKYYLSDYCIPGIINVPIIQGMNETTSYRDSIDIVSVGKKVYIYDFIELPDKCLAHKRQISNDLGIHTRLWKFRESFDIFPDKYVRIVISPRSILPISLDINRKTLEKTKKITDYILKGILESIYYPVFSDQCNQCPYVGECNI